MAWLRAQVLGELAEVAERAGESARAEGLHQQGIALLEATYPGSPALDSARAQLAGLYARSGRGEEAMSLYRSIVSGAKGRALPSIRNLMSPYFALLTDGGMASGDATADLFAASQLLQRPGLAQTQAVLARELSGGSDEASQLFRSATNLGRGIEQQRIALLELQALPQPTSQQTAMIAERQQGLEQLQMQQAEVLEKLAAFPRYRAVSEQAITLDELKATLTEGEAYVKLVTLDRDAYVIFVTPDQAMAWRADATPAQLEALVGQIRESIAVVEGGQVLTYPFDIARAREL
jgi:tetratricopeptide (TPR) repeat protein